MTSPRKPFPFAVRAGLVALALVVAVPATRAGGEAGAPSAPAASPVLSPAAPDADDFEVDPAEPDFTVIDLPTNLRLPRHKLAFRLTHRFSRPLGQGDFHDLVSDFFGFDSGAQIGLGLRFGLFSGTQLAFYRLSDRTIQFSLQQELIRQDQRPLGLSIVGSIEGLDNFGQDYSPALELVLSRKLGTRGSVYVIPAWVGHTNLTAQNVTPDDSTLVLGLGARLRLSQSASVVAEYQPRLAGYKGNRGSGDRAALLTLGIEKRVGGHTFQLNFSNDLGTTPAQTARGQQGSHDWFIGFNLSRKFY